MSVVPFALLLTIPVVLLAKRSPFVTLIVAVWAFALSLTPWGPGIHAAGISIGRTMLHLFGGA